MVIKLYTGTVGPQGDVVNWWNTFESKFKSVSDTNSTPDNKTFGLLTSEKYTIDISSAITEDAKWKEAEKFRLNNLVSNGVVEKIENQPSEGYTTYKLLRDIHVIIDPPELKNKYNSSYINLDLDNEYRSPDYMHTNYIYLHEGAIFDGCGNSITVDCDYNMVNGVETMSDKNRYNIGQSGLFRVYDFMDETYYNESQTGPNDLRWAAWRGGLEYSF